MKNQPCIYTARDLRDAYERGRQHASDLVETRVKGAFRAGWLEGARSNTRVFLSGLLAGGVIVIALFPVLT